MNSAFLLSKANSVSERSFNLNRIDPRAEEMNSIHCSVADSCFYGLAFTVFSLK